MIVDVHGHYTTAPRQFFAWRQAQIASIGRPFDEKLAIGDEEIRNTLGPAQLKFQKERGTDLVLLSPNAGSMGHHYGDERTSVQWARTANDLIHRVCTHLPNDFVGVCQLPQSPGVPPGNCATELERCVEELGFVACNLNPDPSDGYWTDPPLIDHWWYPLYEKLVELEVPAMIHVSGSCNPNFHGTGAHYINGDTTAFMQLIQGDLFKDFPTLKFVIPHGGGAVPYHWGRYRGIAMALGRPSLRDHLLSNVFFDTCVYGAAGMELMVRTIGAGNILFASEMIGAVKDVDPETGHYFDDTKRYLDAIDWLGEPERRQIFEGNALKVYPRLARKLSAAAAP